MTRNNLCSISIYLIIVTFCNATTAAQSTRKNLQLPFYFERCQAFIKATLSLVTDFKHVVLYILSYILEFNHGPLEYGRSLEIRTDKCSLQSNPNAAL